MSTKVKLIQSWRYKTLSSFNAPWKTLIFYLCIVRCTWSRCIY